MESLSQRKSSDSHYVEEVLPKNILWVRIAGAVVVIDKNYVSFIADTLREDAESLRLSKLA